MKRGLWFVVFLVVAGVALAGCGGQKPPKANIMTPSEGATVTSASVAFEGEALDDSNKPAKDVVYVWNFGDGSAEEKGKTVTHNYAQSGEYTVTLTAKTAAQDKDAKAKLETKQTASIKITVNLNQAPTVSSITATPASGPAPLEVAFTSDAADPEGKPLKSYAWEFGDGGTSADEKPTHKYEAAGTFNVKLTVTDEEGATAETTTTVTVEGGAPTTSMAGNLVEIKMITDPNDPTKNYFEPAEITIKAGTMVHFINVSGLHNAVAYEDKIPAGATPFGKNDEIITATYAAGTECTVANGCYAVEFTVPGTYEYRCIPHEAIGMIGKITVEP